MQHREIFAPKYLREIGKQFDLERDVPNLAAVRQHVADWQTSFHNKTILTQSEIQLQKEFLRTFFEGCLGYHGKIGRHDWELDYEQTTGVDATRADGYLGFFTPENSKTVAVIELKDATTDLDRPQNRKNDKRSPVEQAFSYVPKVGPACRWVIVSNFVEIRLYHAQDQGRYEYFHITQLHEEEQLWRFLFLLHRDRLLPHGAESYLEHYHRQRLEQEQTISLDFYKKFKDTRLRLFEHLRHYNPAKPELLLFEKTQKLLDRLIFVFFCEDKGLLPYDMTRKVKQAARASLDPAEGQAIWQQLKGLFRSIDKGNPPQNINRYNGGLFAHDPELDDLQLGDGMAEVLLGLSNFDYDSDLDVNILGHIFEQSISDIEEIKAGIAGIAVEKKQGKRKKDGIFYTPEYITRYIVREAAGGWLDDRKRALGFYKLPELSDADLASVKMQKGRPQGNAKIERHRAFWTAYRDALAGIKVLDPACGSGAFLVQVFDYLSAEGQAVNDELARLSLGLRSTGDLSRNILTNNIFGVDINPESVEITKLSLWLKTADNQSELTALDHNIRCGNSLIDDPAVAGDLAFDWKKEFADIFEGNGGFDVVVGNPPYVMLQSLDERRIFEHISLVFKSAKYKIDTYQVFTEKGLEILNSGGFLGFITPNTFLKNIHSEPIRRLILEKTAIQNVVLFQYSVFQAASVDTCIFILKKEKSGGHHVIKVFQCANPIVLNQLEEVVQNALSKNNRAEFNLIVSNNDSQILEKISGKSIPLETYCDAYFGIQTFDRKIYVSKNKLSADYQPVIDGFNIERFHLIQPSEYVQFIPSAIKSGGNEKVYQQDRICIRQIGQVPIATIVEGGIFTLNTIYNVFKKQGNNADLNYLLGIICSKSAQYYWRKINSDEKVTFPKIKKEAILGIPIPKILTQEDETAHNEIVKKVESILTLHRDLHEHKRRFLALVQAELGLPNITRALENWETLDFATFLAELAKQKISLPLAQKSEWLPHFEQERARAQALLAEIKTTDNRIDEMVFDLYGLTDEERAVVLGA